MYITHFLVQQITRYCMANTDSSNAFVNNLFHYLCPKCPHIPKVKPSGHCFAYLQVYIFNDLGENSPILLRPFVVWYTGY